MLESQQLRRNITKVISQPVGIFLLTLSIVGTLGYGLANIPAVQSALIDVMIARLDIPPHLIVYDPYKETYFEYSSQEKRFVPVARYNDEYDLTYDTTTSPDKNWNLSYAKDKYRFVVSGGNKRFIFRYFCFSIGQIAWSPDSRFIAYRADNSEAKWYGRIMLMSLENGQTWWIGEGDSPRWYLSKKVP